MYRKEWVKSSEAMLTTSESIDKASDPEIRQQALLFVAQYYNEIDEYNEVITYLEKIEPTTLNDRNKCFYGYLLTESFIGSGTLSDEKIVYSMDNYASHCESIGEEYLSYLVTTNKLELELGDSNNSKDTLSSLKALHDNVDSTHFTILLPRISALIAKAYLTQSNLSQALHYAKDVLKSQQVDSGGRTQLIAHQVLALSYEQIGDYQNALHHHLAANKIQTAYLEGVKEKRLAFQMAKQKLIEKDNEIKRLNDQNALLLLKQNLNQTEKENSRLFMLLMGGSLVLLSAFFYRTKVTQLRLKRLAEFDHLTGVFNRGHFTYLARKSLQYDEEAAVAASYILFDLDFFKQINDKHGHPTGDWALRKVAAVCKRQCRKSDLFARLGGEEFCFFLPGSTKETACRMAEHCRRAIEAIDTSETGHNFKITASFGVSDTGQSGFSIAKLMADADAAMYSSKREGRNLVSVYEKDNPKDWPFRAPYVKVDVCLPPSKYGQNKYEPDFSADKWYES